MNITSVTPEQLENLRKLDKMWDNVPPGMVNLDEIDCGTHACLAGWALRFAGWLFPPRKQGEVIAEWIYKVFGYGMHTRLFRNRNPEDYLYSSNDWTVAKERLHHAIEGTLHDD